jgi:predicted RNase H-like HicB family nuclease
MIMQHALNATEVRANFGLFIDNVLRDKPQAIKRNRDIIISFSLKQMMELLSAYELTVEYEQTEEGKFVGSIEQIEDIVAEGNTLEELRRELAKHLIEYAKDYYADYARYSNSPNRKRHAHYIMRVLLEEDIEKVAGMLHA